jgi:hypothetical protein
MEQGGEKVATGRGSDSVKIGLNGLGSTADFSYSPCYEGSIIGHRTVP